MTMKHLLASTAFLAAAIAPATLAGHHHIEAAVSSAERPESETARDARRKPAEILAFAGVEPGMHVADLLGGTGYYTDLFSRAVGDDGSVLNHINYYVRGRFIEAFGPGGILEKRLESPQWQKNVRVSFGDLDEFKSDVPLDMAFMALFYHDTAWQGTERDKMNKAIHDALKPGGVFVVIDHAAEDGSGTRDVKSLHRIGKQLVIDEVTAAGFVLEAESNVLSAPADTRDYHVFRDFATNRDATDRFVLKFRKPAD